LTLALALCAWSALAADPAEIAPDAWVVPAWRAHVYASEDLDPDVLATLARPGVVLWLATRSNTLRPSVIARLPRFHEAYVQVRLPWGRSQWQALDAAPRAGLWVDERALGEARPAGQGARPLAVDVGGELTEEVAAQLRSRRPARTRWMPRDAPNLDAWARFAQLPGARVLVWDWLTAPDGGACPLTGSWPGLAVTSAAVAKACRWGLRLRVRPGTPAEALRPLFIEHPSLEVELDALTDAQAAQARAWLDHLP
jgi:hypothetical protein